MTQRTTGATPEQIERAARDAWNCGLEPDDTRFDDAANKDQYPTRQNAKWWAGNLVRPDERIVSVAELQIQRMSLIAFRDQHAATVVNIQINQRNGDVTEQQIDEWRQDGMDNWKQRYPRAADLIDRITALIGDDA